MNTDPHRLASLILRAELSNSEIARQCGVYRGTVPKYRSRLLDADLSQSDLDNLADADLKKILSQSKGRGNSRKLDEPKWEDLAKELSKPGATKAYLFEEYTRGAIQPMAYTTFCKRLREQVKRRGPVMRTPREPGREVLVDFSGKRPRITDPETGRQTPVELFVACLGASRLAFATAVASQNSEDWIKAHVAMFDYLGGVPRYVIPDNLKAAVINSKRAQTGLRLNERYSIMLRHYDIDALPARPYEPRDKGLVEQSVLHLQRWILYPLSKQTFFSLRELNDAIRPLLDRVNSKPMKRIGNLSRRQIFETEEKHSLKPLPATPFRNAKHIGCFAVPTDYHIPIRGGFFSVPHSLIRQSVEVFETDNTYVFYHMLKEVAIHNKAVTSGSVSTLDQHSMAHHKSYLQNRTRHFETWGSYQSASIRKYLRMHLGTWKNPNSTEMASRKLKRLVDYHGAELVTLAAEKIIAQAQSTIEMTACLKVRRFDSLLARPEQLGERFEPDADQTEILHANIRGAKYYE